MCRRDEPISNDAASDSQRMNHLHDIGRTSANGVIDACALINLQKGGIVMMRPERQRLVLWRDQYGRVPDLRSELDREDQLSAPVGIWNAVKLSAVFLLLGWVLFLAGCSNGGEPELITAQPPVEQPPPPPIEPAPIVEPHPPAAPTLPIGIWQGITKREGRTVLGVVRPSGETWLVYSVVGTTDWAGGVVQGMMTTDGSTWQLNGGLYVNWEHQSRAGLTGSGTWLAKQRIVGSFRLEYDDPSPLPPLYESDGIDLIYDTRSEVPFDLTQAAGTYMGLWIPLQEVAITLREDGAIEGRSAFGCTFHGTATPSGPVAIGEVTFEGPPCINGYATVKGVLGVDLQARKLLAAGFSQDRNQGYVFIGQR